MNNTLHDIANELIQRKCVSFSFNLPGAMQERAAVTVRECEDYDFAEYEEEYVEGEMFAVGPAAPAHKVLATELVFESVNAAGTAVLKEVARILGNPWHGA
jgi:hypothetical protein